MLRRMCPGHFERIHAESERGEEVALRESARTLEGYRKEGRTRGVCRDHKGLYGEGHSMELGLQFGKVTCQEWWVGVWLKLESASGSLKPARITIAQWAYEDEDLQRGRR